ncbi:MAG TPA: helix-turn-helix domain-containing protein [Methanoregula sp.]|nr:helix-turn-helix domain-containing protein [Methanoregula sp.]
MTTDPQFLTPKEVADILGVHQKTVHHWLRTGKLTGTKISYRAWRIPRSALDDLVKQNSNAQSKHAKHTKNDQPSETTQSTLLDSTVQPISATTPASKMKLYIRDIMGEDSRDHN